MTTSEQKLFNVTELLRLPQFPDFVFGSWGPDSLRQLNEDLLYAQSEEEIESALEGLAEARDQVNGLIEASQDEAKIYSFLCGKVHNLEEEEGEHLSASELNNLIDECAQELWSLQAERLLAKDSRSSSGLHSFFLYRWDGVTEARREVMSWFGIKISQDELRLNQSELLQRHLLQAAE